MFLCLLLVAELLYYRIQVHNAHEETVASRRGCRHSLLPIFENGSQSSAVVLLLIDGMHRRTAFLFVAFQLENPLLLLFPRRTIRNQNTQKSNNKTNQNKHDNVLLY